MRDAKHARKHESQTERSGCDTLSIPAFRDISCHSWRRLLHRLQDCTLCLGSPTSRFGSITQVIISPASFILFMSSFEGPATCTCFSHTHSFRTVRPPLRLALALHPVAVGKSSGMLHIIQVLATICVAIRAAASIGVRIPTLETCVTPAAGAAEKESIHDVAVGKSSGMLYIIQVLAAICVAIRAAASVGVHIPTLETCVTPAA